ncbi:MAG: hypothetical protein CMO34_08140 [Verrucomicrobia bacterium]|nr:hypothetical protein [Verrucomicrobiota bacterium]
MKPFLFTLTCFLSISLFGQSPFEIQLDSIGQTLLNAPTQSQRDAANERLIRLIEDEADESLFGMQQNYIKSIGVFTSADSLLKVINWAVPTNENGYRYECFLLHKNAKGDYKRYKLTDTKYASRDFQSISATDYNWPGALYYHLIQTESKLQTYYTLLGWDEFDQLTNRKVIEVIWFTKSGLLNIGAAVFKPYNDPIKMRHVFQYADQNRMQLRYDSLNKRIIFDHLSPSSRSLDGLYEYYGPDFTFDAYKWDGNYWVLSEHADPDLGLEKSKKDFKINPKIIAKDTVLYNPK